MVKPVELARETRQDPAAAGLNPHPARVEQPYAMSNKRSRHQSATVEKESPPQELGASSTSPPQSAAKRRRLGDRTRIATSRPSSTPSTLAATAASPSSSFVRDSSSLSIGSSSHGHSVAVIQGKMDKARRLKSVVRGRAACAAQEARLASSNPHRRPLGSRRQARRTGMADSRKLS
ncbi:uncharacterized protein PFL1_04339 [Pseudozyma flocculosa PF-1]|uniref:Uncharacterized protein n=1 Tax=Pseudozyma flocculosa PF-1 TaxID=1277687 RepID=A0A061H559_9BASI|nr:uncharacterized protein PFL1_04339 [Pseudozyma flocculosa PF-1]EPQ28012.1 hypothetical protein PFL1_04339 [Pseudozyma flocculosa PF-1]